MFENIVAKRVERIGRAVLFLGDCREIMPQMEDESSDMIWMDPPYGHDNHNGDLNSMLNGLRGITDQPIANDDAVSMRDVVSFALDQGSRILRSESCCCCCCCAGGGGPSVTFAWLANRMDGDGLQFFHQVIWDKVNPGIGWRYRRQHELVMVAHRKGGRLLWADDGVAIPNIIRIFPDRQRNHPNEKPLALVAKFVAVHAKPGNVIGDPFMGSGTTLVASVNQKIDCWGIEMDEKHFDKACWRVEKAVEQRDMFRDEWEDVPMFPPEAAAPQT